MTSRRAIGAWGETLAQAFLERHGYTIVTRNFFTRWGEIDIVARQGEAWIFIEVKLRTVRAGIYGQWAGSAERAITFTKKQHWIKAVRAFCFVQGISPEHVAIRFEQISLYLNRATERVKIVKYILPNVIY